MPGGAAPVNRNVVLGVLLSGAFVAILNQTLLATALPVFMEDLNITANTAQWLTTIFMLVNGVMIPITGFPSRSSPPAGCSSPRWGCSRSERSSAPSHHVRVLLAGGSSRPPVRASSCR